MPAPPKVADRIKKLHALTTSPNANEAASARVERDRLMAKYGVTLADFEDDVLEVADDRVDEERLRLAKAVALSRRCTSLASKRHEIGFRGKPSKVRGARALYRALIDHCAANCEIGPNDPGRDTWRICFWIGFVDAVVARLLDDEVSAWTAPRAARANGKASVPVDLERPAPPTTEPDPVVPTKEVLNAASAEFAARCGPWFADRSVNSVRQEGYAAGQNLGRNVSMPARDRATASDRALGSGTSE